MEKAHKLHKGLVQKHERRLPFRVAAGMAAISLASALILSPVNPAMGKDTYTKKESRKTEEKVQTEEKAPAIVATKESTPQDKKNLVPSSTEAIAKDKEEQPKSEKKEVQLGQADIDIKNLIEVPISEMEELDKQTEVELRRYFGVTLIRNKYGLDLFYNRLGILVPGKNWGIIVDVYIGFDGREENNDVYIRVPNPKTGEVEGYIFSLDTLSKIYMKKNGSKMRYVRIIAEYARNQNGDYINIHIVPVKTPTAPITVGTTAMALTYLTPTYLTYSDNNLIYGPGYYNITE